MELPEICAVCWRTMLAGERYSLCAEAARGGGSAQGDGSSTEQLQSFQGEILVPVGYISTTAWCEPSPSFLLGPIYTHRALESWLGLPTACTLLYLSSHVYLEYAQISFIVATLRAGLGDVSVSHEAK